MRKPQKLKVASFPFVRGSSPGERQSIISTLEMAVEVSDDLGTEPIFVELGTFQAVMAKIIMTALNQLGKKCKFYSVDLNQQYYDHVRKHQLKWRPSDHFTRKCTSLKGPCTPEFIEGNSWEAANRFDDGTISWCFVDACHCYQCVKAELAAYVPKTSPGGLILMHDTKPLKGNSQWYHDKSKPRPFGVLRAIKECKELHQQFRLLWEVKTRHGMQVWQKQQ